MKNRTFSQLVIRLPRRSEYFLALWVLTLQRGCRDREGVGKVLASQGRAGERDRSTRGAGREGSRIAKARREL